MNWKELLADVAPAVAAVVTGGNPLAGAAAKWVLDKVGIESTPETAPAALEQHIRAATPEQLAELKRIDNDFTIEMERLGLQRLVNDRKDRESARRLAEKKGMLPQIVLSLVYTVAYFGVIYAYITGKVSVPPEQQVLFGSLIGVMTAIEQQIANFWLGSSSGSKEKTAALGANNS